MNRKAQGATEYLIILAVVIIIALIVVGAMGGIPGIGAAGKSRSSASYWSTADVAIVAYGHTYNIAPASAVFNATIRNNLRTSITLASVSVNFAGTVVPAITCPQTTLFAGQQTKCYWKGVSCSAANAAFSYDITINYQDLETKRNYAFTGDGQKLEGRCATS